ncbi:store-operated calcium entry regulator STIMATE-like [Ischnura elegans]|uniref:store-operated calcium entry regulator STIMATE-like n=1 Tax=Ischnura elegans TaxID=197161 RepID=UPI001ED89886|nr:store-operated calcium entry regulator STIMATE-like [Ischnura elegans]
MNVSRSLDGNYEISVNEGSPSSHCGKDALTDMFGWFIQGVLACLAFTCLILKRFCEPRYERRPWLIWFYDTSKQGMGAMVIHMANVFLANKFRGDPCTWYIISFLLDSSIGLLILYIGIRFSQYLAKTKRWDAINFGEYGKPPSVNAWLAQCCLYVLLMLVVKVVVTLLIRLDFWDSVRDFILSPIQNPRVELAVVVLVIPFFVNALMFWVTDNFLMHRRGGWVANGGAGGGGWKSRGCLPVTTSHHGGRSKKRSTTLLVRLRGEAVSLFGKGGSMQRRKRSINDPEEEDEELLGATEDLYHEGVNGCCLEEEGSFDEESGEGGAPSPPTSTPPSPPLS